MDLSQYAELFLAESKEHLSACNELLLEWERHPGATEPVGGIFRAVHTIKGMAATMGYARVADLAHRMENLLDRLRSPRGVVDFIDIGIGDMRFYTFNVADMAVFCGAALLAYILMRRDRDEELTAIPPAPSQ